jgi:predicted ATPase
MDGFLRAVRLPDADPEPRGHPWDLSLIEALRTPHGLALDPGVTYLVGENGSGKSTLMEALSPVTASICSTSPRRRSPPRTS